MPFPGMDMNVSAANFYTAELAEKEATHRAAKNVRKQLKKASDLLAAGVNTDPEDTETLLVDHWLDGDEFHISGNSRKP